MSMRNSRRPELRLSPIRCMQIVLAGIFVVQLYVEYLYPLRTRTLSPEWWSWMRAAAPLLLIWLLQAVGRPGRRASLALSGDAAERIRWERPRRYGRTH